MEYDDMYYEDGQCHEYQDTSCCCNECCRGPRGYRGATGATGATVVY